jgi:hypothetical protein
MKTLFSSKAALIIMHLLICSALVMGQNSPVVAFDSLHWNIQAKEAKMEDFQGQQCLKIVDGAAYLKDSFESGIVEFDISFNKERAFPGLMFRVSDLKNFEFLYLRPHQSGNPDAIQYCPVIFGNDSWQLYTGEGFCAQKEFIMNSWIHIKVIISGKKAVLYLNHELTPTLFMNQLQREPVQGGLALDNHSPVPVRFANFSYTKLDHPPMNIVEKTKQPLDEGIIRKWQISSRFNEHVLDNTIVLKSEDDKQLNWQPMEVEGLGFINIGKYVGNTTDSNTVFARFFIFSDKAQIKKIVFGFSDRCKVYLNGQILYAGNNGFKVRDYRFYGTIGFWDQVYLGLKKGRNEITVAVSETFGGWAVEAKFDDLKNVQIPEQSIH